METFPRFTELTIELRYMVYGFALPPPPERVAIRLHPLSNVQVVGVSFPPLPAIFHVSCEARKESVRLATSKRLLHRSQVVTTNGWRPFVYLDLERTIIDYGIDRWEGQHINHVLPVVIARVQVLGYFLGENAFSSIRHLHLTFPMRWQAFESPQQRRCFVQSLLCFSNLATMIWNMPECADHRGDIRAASEAGGGFASIYNRERMALMQELLLDILAACEGHQERLDWLQRWRRRTFEVLSGSVEEGNLDGHQDYYLALKALMPTWNNPYTPVVRW